MPMMMVGFALLALAAPPCDGGSARGADAEHWGGVIGGDVQWGGWPWHGKMRQQLWVPASRDPPGPFLRPDDWVANLTRRFDPSLVVLNVNPPMVTGPATLYPAVQPQAIDDLVDLLSACEARRLRVLLMVSLNCATSDATYNRSYHDEPPIDVRGGMWWPHCGADFAEQAGMWFSLLVNGTESLARARGGEELVETIVAWAPQANNDLAGSETRLDVRDYVPDITKLGHALYSLPASRALPSPLVFGLPISVPKSISPTGVWASCGPEQTYRNLQAVCSGVKSPPAYLPITYDHAATNISAVLDGAAAMVISSSHVLLTDFKINNVNQTGAEHVAKIRNDFLRVRPEVIWIWQHDPIPDSLYRSFIADVVH
eukprot:SAG22_NODE_2016_length_3134_cov_4.981878_1_plen_372_part_00